MVPEPPRHPGLRPAGAATALLLVLALLLAGRSWLLRTADETLYEVEDDYAALALGHGIQLDHWKDAFPAPRNPGYFQVNHPGIPLQLVSGLVYQASHEPGATAPQRAAATLARPARFLAADRLAAIAVFALALAALAAVTWRRHGATFVVVPLAILAYAPAWAYHLELLGNETFALPLFLALWLAMQRALVAPIRPRAFFLAGAVAGLSYLNKLNYVAWLLAAGLGLAWFAWRSESTPRARAIALGSYALGSVVSVVGLGAVVLSPQGLRRMFQDHGKVFLNTGHYGEGNPGIVDPGVAWTNFQVVLGRDPLFTTWLAGTLLLLAAVVVRHRRRDRLPVEDQSMLVFLSLSFGLGFLAALKHFGPHYLIPALLPIPFAVLSFRRLLPPLALGAIILAMVGLDARVALTEQARLAAGPARRAAYRAELEQARAVPLRNGIRGWTYKVLAPEYGVSFVTDIAHHRELDKPVYLALFPRDRGYFRNIPAQVPWDAVVYARHEFPRLVDVPIDVRRRSEVAFEGEHLLVLRRKDPPPEAHSPR